MRRLAALNSANILDAFIGGAYMLAIPLLLVDRSIDLGTIGVIFSAYPIMFLVSRLLFASAADSIGVKVFFDMTALGNLASVILYAISSSPFSYAIAKATQGIKEASLWAVNRNATYEVTKSENPHMAVSTILFIRSLAIAIGAVLAGFLVSWIGFRWFFAALAIISILILIPARALDIGQKTQLSLNELFRKLDPRMIEGKFWRTSLVMSTYAAASTLAVGFVLPIFLLSKGLSYWEIGIVFAAYVGVGALLLPATLRGIPSVKNTIIIQTLLYFSAVMFIPLVEGSLMILMVIVMAFGESMSYIVWESLVSRTVRGCENLATSIAFLHMPSSVMLIPAYLLAGVVIEKFGYLATFWIAGILFLTYSITAWRILKSDTEQ